MTDGPLPRFAAPLAVPASWCYRLAVAARNRSFDRGRGVRRLPLATISIGNITVGGTGKTPMVAWAIERLRSAGRRPLIAMRGYKARPGQAGDEEREYQVIAPQTPVVARPDRFEAVSGYLQANPDTADCVVLDDGFQHRALARDLDLVLVDAERPCLDDRLLPAGWLREPAASLKRASAVIVTRASRVDEGLARRIAALHGHWPVAWARHAWRGLNVIEDGVERQEPVSWLASKRVFGLFGTGNPLAVRRAYEAAGAMIAASAEVPDHAEYDATQATDFQATAQAARCGAIATTRKDWTKLAVHARSRPGGVPYVVPDLAIEFLAGESELLRRLTGATCAAIDWARGPSD